MYNWSTNQKSFTNKEEKEKWELEQLVNYGTQGEKIKKKKLLQYFDAISLDPYRRKFMRLILDAN